MYLLYSLLYILALLLLFPSEYFKRPRHLRSIWLHEKFGYPQISSSSRGSDGNRTLWVHAVSVGEAVAAATFIREYLVTRPHDRIVVSTITDTGRAVAAKQLKGLADVIYLPFDLPGPVSRVIKHIRPDVMVIMETELWPNLIKTLSLSRTPVCLLNGRISDNSFNNYMKIKWLFKPVLDMLDVFCVQNESYATRLKEIGVNPEKVNITGSFKFDVKVKDEQLDWARRLSGPVIIAGSTHKGEDEIVLAVYKRLLVEHPGLDLIIVPRHPERFDDVWTLILKESVYCIRRSELAEEDLDSEISSAVILLDTVGELSMIYRVADIVIMGGSFIPHGGQNPLEPAYWGKPVLCGPHMKNFPFIKEFYDSNAAIETSSDKLYDDLNALLGSSVMRDEIGANAKALLEDNRGAVGRAIKVIGGLMGDSYV